MSPSSAGVNDPANEIEDNIITKQLVRSIRLTLAFNVVTEQIKDSLAANILNAYTMDYLKQW
jgi:hypothetical protein